METKGGIRRGGRTDMNKVEDFIQHHGVKGMKWGVRRYQPYPKGKGHKGEFLGKTRKALSRRNEESLKKYDSKKRSSKKKKDRDAYQDIYNTHKKRLSKKYKDPKKLHLKSVSRSREHLGDGPINKAIQTTIAAGLTIKVAKDVNRVANHPAVKQFINHPKVKGAIINDAERFRRMGKNIIQAAKRSPVRYVDGRDMKNVLNVSGVRELPGMLLKGR